jgi:hypothetical protein
MELNCKICNKIFKTEVLLENHLNNTVCKLYKKILFMCKKCNMTFSSIKEIEIHAKECKNTIEDLSVNKIQILNDNLTNENNKLRMKCSELKRKNLLYKNNNNVQIQLEKLKNNVLSNIVSKYTDINPDKLFEYKENVIHVYNPTENDNLEIQIHNSSKDKITKYDKLKIKKSHKKINNNIQMYRTIRKVTTEPQDIDVIENKIKDVENNIDKIIYENFDVSHKEINDIITDIFKNMNTNRNYSKNISEIKQLRNKLLGKLNLEEYKVLIEEHIKKITELLIEKSYNEKKIKTIINTFLSPLDKRIVLYGDYINTNINKDDIEKFKLAIQINTHFSKKYVKFELKDIISNILNFSVSLYPIIECLSWFLFNRYEMYNLIYLEKKDCNKNIDCYTYYSLNKITGDTKYWNLESRLEEISTNILTTVKFYCIQLFRNIYFDVFNDNIYRKEYKLKSQITEYECQQLIENIITLSQPSKFNKDIRSLIKQKATYTPTINDKFNLTCNDTLQYKRMKNLKDSEEDIIKSLMSVFDNLNYEDGKNILEN